MKQIRSETPLISYLHYSETIRLYILEPLRNSYAAQLQHHRIATYKHIPNQQLPSQILENLQQQNKKLWVLHPEQYIYLVSCLSETYGNSEEQSDIGTCFSIECAYKRMSEIEVNISIFYLWVRKKGKFMVRCDIEEPIFKVYENAVKYKENESQYCIKIVRCEDQVEDLFNKGGSKEGKQRIDKLVIIRNRDFVILNIESSEYHP